MQQLITTAPVLFRRMIRTVFAVLLLVFAFLNSVSSFAAPGDILFQDSFNGNLNSWSINSSGGDASLGNETSASGRSLRLRWDTVTITSNSFNAAVPAAEITVWIRRGSDAFSEDTDAGEDLLFQYLSSSGAWVTLETFAGSGTNGEIYNRTYLLPTNALHANLSLRFTLVQGSGVDYDYWHIDDLQVTETVPLVIAVNTCDDFESGFGNWQVSGSGDAGINNMTFSSPGNSMYLRWDTVESTSAMVDFSASSQARVTAWIRRGSDAFSEYPETGENLVLEYLNNLGSWITLETFPGGGTEGEIFNRSYILANDALHTGFRLRFRHTGGSGSDYDYYHIDDVCFYDTVPGPGTWYSMDETAWSGNGSVLDSSGNGNHANPLGAVAPANPATNPAIAGSPGTCGYGAIPNNTNDTIDAIDTNFTPGNTGTISFWFNSNSNWNTDGDRVLFDASTNFGNNSADKNFFLIKQNNNNGSLLFSIEDSSDRNIEARVTNLNFTANTWVHIAVTWDLPGDFIELYVNGVSRATDNTNTNGIIGTTNDVYIGDNRDTNIGDNDWSNYSANGFIDEFRIYQTAMPASQILADMNATHPCTLTDHFDINHDTAAINCQAEPITIEAHLASHVIDTSYTGTLSLTTSTAHGDWTIISGLGTLNNGLADDGAATYNMVAGDNGSVILGLKNTHVETLNINISDGIISELSGSAIASEDQNLAFAASGFTFLADGVANTIGLQIGGKASNIAPGAQVLELQAIRTSPITGACEAALQGVNQIELAFECRNPASCSANQVNINGGTATNITGNPLGVISNYTPVNLDFGDATDTTANFVLNYPDVGEIQLYARYNIPLDDGSNTPSGIYMLGNSNTFVSRPFGFYVAATGNPGATGPGGAVFTQAGSDFNITATAMLYQSADDTDNNGIADGHDDTDPSNNANLANNTPALNYGRETAIENINLSALLNQPVAGNDPGLAGTTSVNSFVNGSGGTSATHYDEVGIIEISGSVADGNYLGIGVAATNNIAGKTGYVGRFIPNHFVIANPIMNNRSDILACADPFTYMDENFRVDFNLQAFNARSPAVITQNYTGAFAKLDITNLADMNYGATDTGNDLSSRLNVASIGTFTNGTAAIQATSSLSRLIAVDGPYSNLQIGTAPLDSDNVALQTLDLSLDGGPNSHGEIGQTDVRYGRLNITNNFGSELLPLNIQLVTQYYANATSQFITNTDDSCTVIDTADVLLYNDQEPKQGRAVGNPVININGGNTTTLTAVTPFVGGIATMNFTAPNAEGYVDMEVQTPVYLLSNLDGIDQGIQGPGQHCTPGLAASNPAFVPACVADTITEDDVPLGRGTFGIFRGSDRVIYIREVY